MAKIKTIKLSKAKETETVVWKIDAPIGHESKGDLEVHVVTSKKRRDDPSGVGYMETMEAASEIAEQFYGVDSFETTLSIYDNT